MSSGGKGDREGRGEGVVVVMGDVDDEGVWSRLRVPVHLLKGAISLRPCTCVQGPPALVKGDKGRLVLCLCTRPLKMQATSAVEVGEGVVTWKLMGLLLVGTFPIDFTSAPTMARSALTVMI